MGQSGKILNQIEIVQSTDKHEEVNFDEAGEIDNLDIETGADETGTGEMKSLHKRIFHHRRRLSQNKSCLTM